MIDLPPELDTPEFQVAWIAWQTHRREIKKTLKPTSISRQLAALKAVGVANAIAAIERSIEKGWTGLFPEDGHGQGTARSAGNVGSSRVGVDETAFERDRERRAAQQARDK